MELPGYTRNGTHVTRTTQTLLSEIKMNRECAAIINKETVMLLYESHYALFHQS